MGKAHFSDGIVETLGNVFELQMGKTPSRNNLEYWNGNYNWVSIADLGNADKYIFDTKEKISDKAVEESKIKTVPKGTVIMSFKLSIGKTAITAADMYTNEAIMAFYNKSNYEIDVNYLYHFCRGTNWGAGTNKAVMGLTLNKANLSKKKIVIPSIEVQKIIAKKLDCVDALAAKRRRQLALLDTLTQSRFVEMFGDTPEQECVTMEEICAIITDGTHQPPQFEQSGIPFLFVSNITNDELTYEAEKFISEKTYEELIKRTPIESEIYCYPRLVHMGMLL